MSRSGSYATFYIGNLFFGIPIAIGVEVTKGQEVTPVPLGPKEVAGFFNLRGHIVTAIDMRVRLGLPTYPTPEKVMKVVVEYQHDLFALMVDSVGDVLALPMNRFEKVPSNMDASWRAVAAGVFKLEKELLVILDVASVIDHLMREVA